MLHVNIFLRNTRILLTFSLTLTLLLNTGAYPFIRKG